MTHPAFVAVGRRSFPQASSTTDEQIKLTDDVVSYDPNDATTKGPLGEYHARRMRVLRPQ